MVSWTNDIRYFVVAFGISTCFQLQASTYFRTIYTQIERRYGVSSTYTGTISSMISAGQILGLAMLSIFSEKFKHRPRAIFICICITAFAALVCPLVHFLTPVYNPGALKSTFSNVSAQQVCMPNVTDIVGLKCEDGKGYFQELKWLMNIIMLAHFIIGIGFSIPSPLGYTYIDEYSKGNESGFYFSIISTIFIFGIALSLFLSSFCSKIYVDWPYYAAPEGLEDKDDNWVGAWWLGYLVIAVGNFLSGYLMIQFPAKMIRIDAADSGLEKREQRAETYEATMMSLKSLQISENVEKTEFDKLSTLEKWKILLKQPILICFIFAASLIRYAFASVKFLTKERFSSFLSQSFAKAF